MAAIQVKCPSCGAPLKLAAAPPAGSSIKCPKCDHVFRLTIPSAEKTAPTAAAVATKTAASAQRADDDDRPVRKRSAVEEDDDIEPSPRRKPMDRDDDDDVPRNRGGRRKKSAGSGKVVLLVVGAVVLVFVVIPAVTWLLIPIVFPTYEPKPTAKTGLGEEHSGDTKAAAPPKGVETKKGKPPVGETRRTEPPAGGPAKEDAEVGDYFKKKKWSLFNDLRLTDSKPVVCLNVGGEGPLTAEDYKMIARAKTVQLLDLRKAKIIDDGLKTISGMPRLETIIVAGDDVTDAGIKNLAACQTLEAVSLTTKAVTDAGVKELAALSKLRWLFLNFMTLDGSCFEAFAGSKTLESITLEYVDGLTDDGAKHLGKLPKLNELKIGGGFGEKKLTATGIKAIVDAHMPAKFEFDKKLIDDDLLEALLAKGWLYGPSPPRARDKKPATPEEVKYISLGDSKVTDKGMRLVLNCTNADSLYLGRTGITDETLKKLSDFKKLKYISLEGTKVTAAGLEAISGAPIEHLAMQGCELSEEAFKAFGKMTALEELWLSDAMMKSAWLKHIAKLPRLRELNLMRADFDDTAVKYVVTMPNIQGLTLNSTNLGDAGFQELLKLPKLKSLYVDSTKVSKEVYQKAKKEHPKMFLFNYSYDR